MIKDKVAKCQEGERGKRHVHMWTGERDIGQEDKKERYRDRRERGIGVSEKEMQKQVRKNDRARREEAI